MRRAALLVGPSGSGKTKAVHNLSGSFKTCDMDEKINTGKKYKSQEIHEILRRMARGGYDVIASSVMKSMFLEVGAANKENIEFDGVCFRPIIFLRTVSDQIHRDRLEKPTAHSSVRSSQHIESVLNGRGELNLICSIISDAVIDTDGLTEDQVADKISEILDSWKIHKQDQV